MKKIFFVMVFLAVFTAGVSQARTARLGDCQQMISLHNPQAISCLQEVIGNQPGEMKAYFLLGQELFKAGQYDRAANFLTSAPVVAAHRTEVISMLEDMGMNSMADLGQGSIKQAKVSEFWLKNINRRLALAFTRCQSFTAKLLS